MFEKYRNVFLLTYSTIKKYNCYKLIYSLQRPDDTRNSMTLKSLAKKDTQRYSYMSLVQQLGLNYEAGSL